MTKVLFFSVLGSLSMVLSQDLYKPLHILHIVPHIPITQLDNTKLYEVDMYNEKCVKAFSYMAQIRNLTTTPEVFLNSFETSKPSNFEREFLNNEIEPKIKKNIASFIAQNSLDAKKFAFTRLDEEGQQITDIYQIQQFLSSKDTYRGIFKEKEMKYPENNSIVKRK